MAKIDRRAQDEYHISGLVLMENAGIKALLRYVELEGLRRGERLLFIAGGGNNGGDALVMARQALLMYPSCEPRVVLVKPELGEPAASHAAAVRALGIPVRIWSEEPERVKEEIERADRIFDGIAGTGLEGALRSPLDELVRLINSRDAERDGSRGKRSKGESFRRIAIDVPSGLGEGFTGEMPAVRADLTLTMGLPKSVLYSLYGRPCCGRIERIDLGFPPQLLQNPEDSGELVDGAAPMALEEKSYKGDRGHVGVFAGAVGTTGAAALATRAAAAAGAGLVSLNIDSELYPSFAGRAEGAMVRPVEEDEVDTQAYSSLVVGSGWGGDRGRLLEQLMAANLPSVLDADGLRAAHELSGGELSKRESSAPRRFFGGNWVLTPHPGEFRFISDIGRSELFRDPFDAVREAARRLDAVVVLKAHIVYIASPDGRYSVVDGMNPAMGTGGSGDILAGTIGGLLSGGIDPYNAAVRASAAHQAAGRELRRRLGWFNAEELPTEIARLLYYGFSPEGSPSRAELRS